MVDAGGGAVHDTAAGVRVSMVPSEARGCKVYDTLLETRRLVSSSGSGTIGTDVAPAIGTDVVPLTSSGGSSSGDCCFAGCLTGTPERAEGAVGSAGARRTTELNPPS